MIKKIKGIALIQILLISAILSVLALYLTKTAKEQVSIARWLDNKAEAQINLHNSEVQLIFSLLTQPLVNTENVNVDNQIGSIVASKWNFFGKAFSFNHNVSINMQDQAGLIHAYYPIPRVLKAFLLRQNYTETQVNNMVDSLLDWQDLDNIPRPFGNEDSNVFFGIRNGPIPDLTDIEHITAIPPRLYHILEKNLTIYRRGNFNPMNASVELITALSNENTANQIVSMRNVNTLTKRTFIELTGIKEENDIYMYPSNYVEIKLQSKVGKVMVKKDIIIKFSPTASNFQSPINIYSSRG